MVSPLEHTGAAVRARIRLCRSSHDSGSYHAVDVSSGVPRSLVDHLDLHPVRSVIIELGPEQTIVSLLCERGASADYLPAWIVLELAERGFLPAATLRALAEAKVIAGTGASSPVVP